MNNKGEEMRKFSVLKRGIALAMTACLLAGCGQTAKQFPQCVQAFLDTINCGAKESPSGLWHQSQRSGQPFKKTVVLIPGPSKTANCFISKNY